MAEFHREEFLYLADVTHKSALIAWGAFFFRVKGKSGDGDFKLVDDGDLDHVHPPRHQTIGARSEPYGRAVVEVFDAATGRLAAGGETRTANHCRVTGLLPDTAYTYRVTVNGEPWGEGELRDWVAVSKDEIGLRKLGNRYDNRFRTHPHPVDAAPLTFAVLGDFGTGIRKPDKPTSRQGEVAGLLRRAVDQAGVRLVLTTGDNIYAGKKFLGLAIGDQGDEDDDWYFTFYQPYRYVVNRVPFYPSVGNHDSGESEFENDDRTQLADNFHVLERFAAEAAAGRASLVPGLFYRFRYGSDIEFICLDTSKASLIAGDRFFMDPRHAPFLNEAFRRPGEGDDDIPAWRIPFAHHPPYTAGPTHSNSKSFIKHLVPRFREAGVRVVFCGHEHNFQLSHTDGIHYFVTGGGGKVSTDPPRQSSFAGALTVAWASAGHFLLVDVDGPTMTVRPIGGIENGQLRDIALLSPAGQPVPTPITVPQG